MTEPMTPTRPTPPLPPSQAAVDAATERLRHPLALFVVALMNGLGAAILAGIPSGSLIGWLAVNDCSATDGWCELGAVAAGFFVGVVIGGIAYIVAGVVTVNRCRVQGRRAGHIVAHLATPPVFVFLAGVAANR